jgi:hypothetical protein
MRSASVTLPGDLHRTGRTRQDDQRRAHTVRDDDWRPRGTERLAREEEVARRLVTVLLTHVVGARRRQVVGAQDVRVPQDHHLDGSEVRHLDLVRVHVRTRLHHRVGIGAGGSVRIDVGHACIGLGRRTRTRERIRSRERIGSRQRSRRREGVRSAGCRERVARGHGSGRDRHGGRCHRSRGHGHRRCLGDIGSRRGARRHRGRSRRRDLCGLEMNQRGADLDLVARPDLALVDALSVDERAWLVAEIDQRDVRRRCDLDDRVHARRELVVDAQVTPRVLSDLDDVLRNRVPANELIALVERKREGDLRLALAIHREAFCRGAPRRRLSD